MTRAILTFGGVASRSLSPPFGAGERGFGDVSPLPAEASDLPFAAGDCERDFFPSNLPFDPEREREREREAGILVQSAGSAQCQKEVAFHAAAPCCARAPRASLTSPATLDSPPLVLYHANSGPAAEEFSPLKNSLCTPRQRVIPIVGIRKMGFYILEKEKTIKTTRKKKTEEKSSEGGRRGLVLSFRFLVS